MNQTAANSDKTLAMLCHLGALGGFLIPFGNVIVPLVIWLVKKDQSVLVAEHGKESLNFQISMLIYFVISLVLTLILIGFLLMLALVVFDIVMIIIATIKVNDGQSFRYPLCIRLIK